MNNARSCDICGGPVNDWGRLCDGCLRSLLADPETLDDDEPEPKPEPEPVYSIAIAFSDPLCETRGILGLIQTMPQLAPELYQVRERGHIVADAKRNANGSWLVEFKNGLTLMYSPIVV